MDRFIPSERMAAVQTPVIPTVAELIRANPDTISLGQGVAYYGPPKEAVDQITAFLNDPSNNRYGAVQGDPRLLELLESKLRSENDIDCHRGFRVVVTAGANMGFLNALCAITDPGDEIILPVPYYFNQEMAIRMLSCDPVLVPTGDDYQLCHKRIKAAITERTRAIVTISPNNPSGAVYPEDSLSRVNAICREHSLYHISDEAYEYFVYGDARHFSPGSIANAEQHTISLFSLSKAYGLASWRIGYMVAPEHLYAPVLKVQDTNLICPPLISQHAAIGALKVGRGYCLHKRTAIEEIREIIVHEIGRLGSLCTAARADGAFYFLIGLRTKLTSMQVVEKLVRDYRVAVIPGITFGMNKGCYLRISYGALQKQSALEGIRRLTNGFTEIASG